MPWGPDPREEAAAVAAAAEARERAANRPLTPGERQIVNALERIAEALEASKPVPLEACIGTVQAGGPGTWADLLDAEPADLALAVDAGVTALANMPAAGPGGLPPDLTNQFTRDELERFAEVVIDAALRQAAQIAAANSSTDLGGQEAATEEAVTGG